MFKYPLFFFLILELNPSSFLEEIHMLALPCLMTHEQVWLEGCLSFFSKHIITHYHTLSGKLGGRLRAGVNHINLLLISSCAFLFPLNFISLTC